MSARLASLLLLYLSLRPALSAASGGPTTACLGLPEVIPKRYATHRGYTVELTLGMTERVTNQLVTHVFYIFLKEVLGYPHVSKVFTKGENITALFANMSNYNDKEHPPRKYMMNLEVWLPPDFNTVILSRMFLVRECGLIGPMGRYGWFIPKQLSNVSPNMDDWRAFQSARTAKVFALPDRERNAAMEHTIKMMNNSNNPTYYCEEKYCNKGVYTPKKCSQKPYATLLSDFPSTTGFVVNDIEALALCVEVVWVGPNLHQVIKSLLDLLTERSTPLTSLVFLTSTPSPLVIDIPTISVGFPPCDSFAEHPFCHYTNMRLVKLAWTQLINTAYPAYEALQKMEFTSEDYKELIQDYLKDPNLPMWDIACGWMKKHFGLGKEETNVTDIQDWNPTKDEVNDERKELFIGGIFPLTTNDRGFTAHGIVQSAVMAIKAVNANSQVLRDYRLKMILNDGMCKSDVVMKTFIDYIINNEYYKLVGILGPACSDTLEPLVGVSRHFRTVVISYSAEGSSFSRAKSPYFFRTIGENKQYKYVYLKLLKKLKWNRVASLTEDGTKYTEYISHTQDLLQREHITFVANRKFPQDWQHNTMLQYLEELKEKNARIIIADVNNEAARAVMCEAYHQHMTGKHGFVWFLPHWLSPRWYEIETSTPGNGTTSLALSTGDSAHSAARPHVRCTTAQMKEAINGYFSLTHSYFAPDEEMMQENITVGQWRQYYRGNCSGREHQVNPVSTLSNYAGYAYDAVWVYAFALDKLIKENESRASSLHSENTTKRFIELIQETNFNGVSGRIQFSGGPSRFSSVNVLQWLDGNTTIVGTYFPNITNNNTEYSNGRLELYEDRLKWLSGSLPWDGTVNKECAIQGLADFLGTSCDVAILAAQVIVLTLIVTILIVIFVIIKRRYDKKVQLTEKYMKYLGIDLLSASNTMGSLDKWEIPRDRIVINRKLGEGAFGYVYGGETYFNEKGWVAVAVKTLKVGSSTEEKLDFLSEAEVMKRFDHKNIVQLLGVCTKNEPVYTIMEFMLYGDLKTFLLARRHLVNEKLPDESDEISSKKLTNMALDVARALSYLAELKYVHRDVASRNCLVNLNRVVKLGDFGMTRPMSENDYYRFNRKGMLPVRWMAPESLALGVFTPASDIWSYGVLLYEVITFGSFPFQGMSNNQVLDHVKAGNTLNIPKGIKPQLDNLIKSCWNKEVKKRPPASEIVEFLANNPRLLAPTLDVPLSSVQMEDTGEFCLSGQEKAKKFTMSGLRQRSQSHEISTEPLLPAVRNRTSRNCSVSDEQQDSIL